MDKVIIAGCEDKGTKYCVLENDGVGLCVCKHRPCEQLQRLKEENERLKKEVETWNYQADKQSELSDIWFNTAETYKQILQEIREIVETEPPFKYCSCCGEIKAKINEVIGAE